MLSVKETIGYSESFLYSARYGSLPVPCSSDTKIFNLSFVFLAKSSLIEILYMHYFSQVLKKTLFLNVISDVPYNLLPVWGRG